MTFDEMCKQLQTELFWLSNQTGYSFTLEQIGDDFTVWCDVTTKAQRVFGDIVSSAKQKVLWRSEFYGTDVNETIQDVREFAKHELNNGDKLDTSCIELYLTFTNGVVVKVGWSEWGEIKRVEE